MSVLCLLSLGVCVGVLLIAIVIISIAVHIMLYRQIRFKKHKRNVKLSKRPSSCVERNSNIPCQELRPSPCVERNLNIPCQELKPIRLMSVDVLPTSNNEISAGFIPATSLAEGEGLMSKYPSALLWSCSRPAMQSSLVMYFTCSIDFVLQLHKITVSVESYNTSVFMYVH